MNRQAGKLLTRVATILISAGAASSSGAEEVIGVDGVLNPEEMSIARVVRNVERGKLDMMTCASGYYLTKKGVHDEARKVFTACAEAGWTSAMTWLSYMDQNGLAHPASQDRAADWDLQAAEAGDALGKFNYGMALMLGRGVEQDVDLGIVFIDEAAKAGLNVAIELQQAGYDHTKISTYHQN